MAVSFNKNFYLDGVEVNSNYFFNSRKGLREITQEEKVFVELIRKDKKAKNLFLKENMMIATSVAKRFNSFKDKRDLAEMKQEAFIGMLFAIDSYDFEKKFLSHIYYESLKKINNLRGKDCLIRVPAHWVNAYTAFKRYGVESHEASFVKSTRGFNSLYFEDEYSNSSRSEERFASAFCNPEKVFLEKEFSKIVDSKIISFGNDEKIFKMYFEYNYPKKEIMTLLGVPRWSLNKKIKKIKEDFLDILF